nr:hypothetical protein [Actinotalea sp. Marseille-Q4924]
MTRWHTPVTASPAVITAGYAAGAAASALMVSRTESKAPGWSPAATVQPPIIATGARAADTRERRGTGAPALVADGRGGSGAVVTGRP